MNTHPQAIELSAKQVIRLRNWIEGQESSGVLPQALATPYAELRYAEAYVIATAAYIEARNAVYGS